jgi:hypothetical protein
MLLLHSLLPVTILKKTSGQWNIEYRNVHNEVFQYPGLTVNDIEKQPYEQHLPGYC